MSLRARFGHHYATRFTTEAQESQGFDKRTAEVSPAPAQALLALVKVEIPGKTPPGMVR